MALSGAGWWHFLASIITYNLRAGFRHLSCHLSGPVFVTCPVTCFAGVCNLSFHLLLRFLLPVLSPVPPAFVTCPVTFSSGFCHLFRHLSRHLSFHLLLRFLLPVPSPASPVFGTCCFTSPSGFCHLSGLVFVTCSMTCSAGICHLSTSIGKAVGS